MFKKKAKTNFYDDLIGLYGELEHAKDSLEFYLRSSACVADCGLCCQQSCSSSLLEATFAAKGLWSIPSKRRESIIARIAEWLKGKRYPAPCPFLNEIQKCDIYPWRPIHCRTYGVTRAGRLDCKRPVGKSEVIGPDSDVVKRAKRRATTLTEELLSQQPILARVSWFPSLVYATLFPDLWNDAIKEGIHSTLRSYYMLDPKHNWIISQDDMEYDSKTRRSLKVMK
jgi:Fe-S-cluster containining protein